MTGPLVEIGRIRKSHGVHGELRVYVEEIYYKDFQNAKFVFIGTAEKNIPYFIKSNRSATQPILKLEDVDTREAADALGKAYLFLPEKDITVTVISPEEDMDTNEFLVGYTLMDEAEKKVGSIIRIDQYPQQEMLVCEIDGREKLIPLHESLVEYFDEEKRVLVMQIPEGLLEL